MVYKQRSREGYTVSVSLKRVDVSNQDQCDIDCRKVRLNMDLDISLDPGFLQR